MFDISTVKARGRAAFKANYWPSVIVAFIYTLFFGGSGASGARQASQQVDPSAVNQLTPDQQAVLVTAFVSAFTVVALIGILVKILLTNPLEVGCARFFRKTPSSRAPWAWAPSSRASAAMGVPSSRC